MITTQTLMSKLSDCFAKRPDSTLGKLMGIVTEQLSKVEVTQNLIREWRDIDNAEGATLDRIGENIVQVRGAATDEVYRVLIKSKIARNFSNGDINTIISVIATSLNADPSEIRIEEKYADPVSPEPAAITISHLPISKLNAAGMSLGQFSKIVQKTMAAGVRVSVIELSGTFAFSSIPDTSENDNNAGFGDISGTIGGYLGAAYGPDSGDDNLPV